MIIPVSSVLACTEMIDCIKKFLDAIYFIEFIRDEKWSLSDL